jgi:hypothetical protein
MTKTDAILGSAFMPAPIKWLNAGFGKSTGKFEGQNSYTVGKTDNFMADAFGDMGDRFAKARKESGKKYGLFSNVEKKTKTKRKSLYDKCVDEIYYSSCKHSTCLDCLLAILFHVILKDFMLIKTFYLFLYVMKEIFLFNQIKI